MSREHGTVKRSNLCSNTWLSRSCFDVTGWATCSTAWMRTLQWGTPSSVASSRWRQLVTPSHSSPLTLIRYIYSPRITGITYSKHCRSDIVYFFGLSCRDSKKKKKLVCRIFQISTGCIFVSAVDLWYLFVLLIRCASGLSTGTWPQRRSTHSWGWCMKHWLTAKKGNYM